MLKALMKTMRPRQWTKNAFVLAAVVFDQQLFNPAAILRSFGAFFVFCLLSGTVYFLNDIIDVEADRQHPKKRLRPGLLAFPRPGDYLPGVFSHQHRLFQLAQAHAPH